MIEFTKKWYSLFHKKADTTPKWQIDDETWELLDKETAEFFFQEGEKFLINSNSIGDKINQRCYTLISVLISICPLLIGVIVAINDEMKCIASLIALFVFICIVAICFLAKLLLPRFSKSIGREPHQLMNKEVLRFYTDEKDRKRNVMILEIERLQHKIKFVTKSNEQRAVIFGIVLTVLIIAFLIICITSLSILVFLA